MFYLDIETYNGQPINHGTSRYAETADLLLLAYAKDDEPVKLWDATKEPMPAEVSAMLYDSDEPIVAHNSAFEESVLAFVLPRPIDASRWRCSMARAMAHSLPGSLEKLGEVLGLAADQQKLKDGKALVRLFCCPRPKNMKLRRATEATHPAEWERFKEYCVQDVAAMRTIWNKLPAWNYPNKELWLWQLDRRINMRGVAIDTELAAAAIATSGRAQALLAKQAQDLTDGAVQAATQRDAMLRFISATYGVVLPDLRGSTVEKFLETQDDMPAELRELLLVRASASKTSAAKYKRLVDCTSHDGRLRNILAYCGASRTGRWAGRLFQPQNLPRPSHKQKVIDCAIEHIKAGSLDLVESDVMELVSSAIRGSIVAPASKKLCVADLSNIEGRVLAWLSNETWKLRAFRDYDDGKGPDLYALAYAKAFGVTPENVMENKEHGDGSMRQIGKVMELACIAEGQLVLTSVGLVPIENVTTHMRVWDGVEFVSHKGVICRGTMEVFTYDNLAATEDHLVWVEGQHQPIHFGVAAASGQRLLKSGTGWHPVWVGDDYFPRTPVHSGMVDLHGFDEMQRMPARELVESGEPYAGKKQRLSSMFSTEAVAEVVGEAQGVAHDRRKAKVFDILEAGPRNRFTVSGCLVHNCGYQGNVGAFITFATAYGIDLEAMGANAIATIPAKTQAEARDFMEWLYSKEPKTNPQHWVGEHGRTKHEAQRHAEGYRGQARYGLSEQAFIVCNSFVRLWREAHASTVSFWKLVGDAVRKAIQNPGQKFAARRVTAVRTGNWLRLILPSGRALCYPSPKVDDSGAISYMGTNQYTRKWGRIPTYEGSLVENLTQAAARDVLAANMPRIEGEGYEIVLSVHDELLTETPDTPAYSVDRLVALMSTVPDWAPGLPLAADGFEAHRYKK